MEKDALIARIDPRDFEAALREAKGRLAQVQAALERAKSDYERIVRIREKDPGAASESMLERRREAVDSAKAEIQSARAAVDAAQLNLSYTDLRAPFEGIVSKRYVNNFQEVQAKQPVVSLDDVNHLEILVDMPENIMAVVKEEQGSAYVEFPTAPDRQFPLTLKEFATRADSQSQTYQVVFEMPQPEDLNVFPGMSGTVTGVWETEETEEQVSTIPAAAVDTAPDGGNYVWVVDPAEKVVRKRPVQVGRVAGTTDIVILEGLAGGETLVGAGVTRLREGMKVSIWNPE
jgi:RND family efflux transporter MFP subunit